MSDVFKNIEIPYKPAQAAPKETQNLKVDDALASSPAYQNSDKSDSIEISSSNTKKQKKGPIKKIKGFIANVKKGIASASEYAKGMIKGVTTGALAAGVIYMGGDIINHFREKSAQNAGNTFKKIPNKFLAGAAAVLAVGINIWNASLNATERSSDIEHRWTGHQNNN